MTNEFLPYIVVEVYCFFYAVTIIVRLNRSIGTEHEIMELRRMLGAFLFFTASDSVWALVEGNIIQICDFANATFNGISLVSITAGCYFWYKFVDDRLHPSYADNKYYDFIIRIPFIIVLLLDVISIFTGWIFYIGDTGTYQMGKLFFLQEISNYFYLLVPTVNAVIHAVKTRSKQRRREYGTYSIYMLAPLASGFMEDSLYTVPILALNIFLVVHVLFLTIQDNQVYNDSLTELNNRRRLNQFLEDSLPKASATRRIIIIVMDINCFKSINDTFGHVEGDKALKSFAKALKVVAGKHNAFIARYGGDEFCFVAELKKHTPEEICKDIRDTIYDMQDKSNDYLMTASIGYTVCSKPEDDIDVVMGRADKMLYENKEAWHKSLN